LSAAEVEEWRWLVHSRILRPNTADVLQQAADEEWWVLPGMRAVLQLRLRNAIPKIHGLVVRTPRQGDGRRLVEAVLGCHPALWVGAHPTAVGFYHKLGFRHTTQFLTTPSEVALLREDPRLLRHGRPAEARM
jgi:GNAT superfamily N-acetyltransferase